MKKTVYRVVAAIGILAGCLSLLSGCTQDPQEPETGTFTDSRDRHMYRWVRIGNQVWMAENLAWLPAVNSPADGSDTLPHYYVYDYTGSNVQEARESDYYSKYGVFYNWIAAINRTDSSSSVSGNTRGVCPEGWHLPSDAEWDNLVEFLGGEYVAGHKMKSVRGWNSYEGESGKGDNSSGFNALPAGSRHNGGGFYSLGYNSLFWTSTNFGNNSAWYRYLGYFHNGVYRYYSNKQYGFSVRCVCDD